MDSQLVYLVQTDTSVGFLSSDSDKLSRIKKRPASQKILQEVDSFQTLKSFTRIPKKYKKLIRNLKSTTFIYPNGKSFRVVDKNSQHYNFIKKFKNLYSTSANETNKEFNLDFAKNNCDVEMIDNREFNSKYSSKIYKIYKNKIKKIR